MATKKLSGAQRAKAWVEQSAHPMPGRVANLPPKTVAAWIGGDEKPEKLRQFALLMDAKGFDVVEPSPNGPYVPGIVNAVIYVADEKVGAIHFANRLALDAERKAKLSPSVDVSEGLVEEIAKRLGKRGGAVRDAMKEG